MVDENVSVDRVFDRSDRITKLLDELRREIILLAEDTYTPEELAEVVASIHAVKSQAGELWYFAEEAIGPALGRETFELATGSTVEAKTGQPRKKWDHQELAKTVARRITDLSTDIDTGEITATPEQVAFEMLRYAAPSYWRVTKLSEIGIDANDYCELGEPKLSIVVRRPK